MLTSTGAGAKKKQSDVSPSTDYFPLVVALNGKEGIKKRENERKRSETFSSHLTLKFRHALSFL